MGNLRQCVDIHLTHVTVPGKNQTLFRYVFRPRYYCSAKLPLRAVLIHAAKMHEYLISPHSEYEPRP